MAAMGCSVLKQNQIYTDSSRFLVFEIFDFIVLKTISRGYDDDEGLSAVLAKAEGATCFGLSKGYAISDFSIVCAQNDFKRLRMT